MKKRTQLDLLFQIFLENGGPEMVEAFKSDCLPHLELSARASEPISEADFEYGRSRACMEWPALMQFCMAQIPSPVGLAFWKERLGPHPYGHPLD